MISCTWVIGRPYSSVPSEKTTSCCCIGGSLGGRWSAGLAEVAAGRHATVRTVVRAAEAAVGTGVVERAVELLGELGAALEARAGALGRTPAVLLRLGPDRNPGELAGLGQADDLGLRDAGGQRDAAH